MLNKFLIGGDSSVHWVIDGLTTGIKDGTGVAVSDFLSVNSEYAYLTGAMASDVSSSDGAILCFNTRGQLVWGRALTEPLVTSPNRKGQFAGNNCAATEDYVISVHDMEDEDYSIEFVGVVQCRSASTGSLVWQRQVNNSRCYYVCAADGFGYVGLSADSEGFKNYARFNLANGVVSSTNIRYAGTSGSFISMGCDTGSSVYFMTEDPSALGNGFTDASEVLEITTTGTLTSGVKFDVGFASSSIAGSDRCSVVVKRISGTDYVYVVAVNQATDAVNVVKFSNLDGGSSTVSWQKAITRAGWDDFNYPNLTVDSDGDVYVAFGADDGGGNTNRSVVKLDGSDGSNIAQLSLGDEDTIRGLEAQDDAIIMYYNNTLIRIPDDLSTTGTYGSTTFTSTSAYTVSTSSVTFSAYNTTQTTDSYTFGTSSFGDESVTDDSNGLSAITITEIPSVA